MTNQKDIFNLIRQLTGQANILTIPRIFIHYTGSVEAALLLSQIIYWSDRNPRGPWFYKSYKEWEQEIGLSIKKLRRAANILKVKKLIKTKVKKANGSPTLHYLFDQDAFIASFCPFVTFHSTQTAQTITETKTKTNDGDGSSRIDEEDFLDYLARMESTHNSKEFWEEVNHRIMSEGSI